MSQKLTTSQSIPLLLGTFLLFLASIIVISMIANTSSTDIRSKAAPGPYGVETITPTKSKLGGYPGCGEKWCVPLGEWPIRCIEKIPSSAQTCSSGRTEGYCCTLK